MFVLLDHLTHAWDKLVPSFLGKGGSCLGCNPMHEPGAQKGVKGQHGKAKGCSEVKVHDLEVKDQLARVKGQLIPCWCPMPTSPRSAPARYLQTNPLPIKEGKGEYLNL